MWHPLTFVAESRFLDADKFIAFARRPDVWKKHGLVSAGQGLEVSTWNVDALVADYKASIGADVAKADRDIAIGQQRQKLAG